MPVYAIQAGENGPVKLGKADDPHTRLIELQCANHERLRLLKVWEGGLAEEAALHLRFAGLRRGGEWFAVTAAMLDEVELEVLHPSTPEPIERSTACSIHCLLQEEIIRVCGGPAALAAAVSDEPWRVVSCHQVAERWYPEVADLCAARGRPDLTAERMQAARDAARAEIDAAIEFQEAEERADAEERTRRAWLAANAWHKPRTGRGSR